MHSTRRFHAKGAFQRLRRYFETRSLRYCAGLFAVLLGLVALAAPSPYCIETPGPTQDVLGSCRGGPAARSLRSRAPTPTRTRANCC